MLDWCLCDNRAPLALQLTLRPINFRHNRVPTLRTIAFRSYGAHEKPVSRHLRHFSSHSRRSPIFYPAVLFLMGGPRLTQSFIIFSAFTTSPKSVNVKLVPDQVTFSKILTMFCMLHHNSRKCQNIPSPHCSIHSTFDPDCLVLHIRSYRGSLRGQEWLSSCCVS